MINAIYRRLMERDFALEDPEDVMLLATLTNIFEHDNRLDELAVELFDTLVLRTEEVTNVPAISIFVPSNVQRSDILDRLGEPA